MPFKSEAQRGFLFANHPEIAKRWAREYPNQGQLPEHVGSSDEVRKRAAHAFSMIKKKAK